MTKDFLPILVFMIFALGFASVVLVLSNLLGRKRPTPVKTMPYECGIDPVGSARERFSVKFYVTAMLFLIFDIEVAFIYPWAVIFRDIGIFGFVEMMVFVAVLLMGLIFVWKKGALEWD